MKVIRTLALVAITAGLLAEAARAIDSKVSGELDIPLLSAYVWRGQVLNDRPVVQPSLTISQYGFSLNTWANFNAGGSYNSYGDGNQKDFSQVNLTASYANKVGPECCPIAIGGGLIQYLFPNQTQILSTNGMGRAGPGTRELYLALGLPDVILAPKLQLNYDIDAVNGLYANLSVSQTLELLKDRVSLTGSAALGAGSKKNNDSYYGENKNALVDMMVGLALPITLITDLRINPAVQYIFLPDSTMRDAADTVYGHKDRVVGSLTLSYVF